MPGPYAIRVRTADGWQEIALVGAQGPPGVPGTPPLRVTSLPSSPSDGQQIIYVADAAAGVLWHLRYNAGSASAYKWEKVGGSPLMRSNVNDVQNTTGNWTNDLTTMTVPLAGEYMCACGSYAGWWSGAAGTTTGYQWYYRLWTGTVELVVAITIGSALTGESPNQSMSAENLAAIAAGTVVQPQHYTNIANGFKHGRRWARLDPVRVG